MDLNGTSLQRWAGLLISLFAVLLVYWDMSFNVIAIPLKETFNYTQSQVELVSSLATAGYALSFLESVLTSRFGFLCTYAVEWMVSPACLLVLYSAVVDKQLFTNWPILIGFIQFIISMTVTFLFISIVNIGVNNFPKKHTGKVIAFYTASGATSKFFYAGMLETFFSGNFGGYLLTLSALWGTVFGICFFVHRPLPLKESEQSLLDPDLSKETYHEYNEQHTKEKSEEKSPKEMITSPYFLMILLSSTLLASCSGAILNNMTLIGQSAGMLEPLDVVYVLAFAIVPSRLAAGLVCDKISSETARLLLLLMYYMVLIAGLVLMMVWLTKTSLPLAAVFVGVAIGCAYTVPLAVITAKFGRSRISLIVGLFNLLYAFFIICIQTFIGFIYDMHVSQNMSENRCIGASCFFWSFGFLLGLCLLSTIFLIIAFLIEKFHNK